MSEVCRPAWTEMSRLEATCIGVHMSWSHHRRGAGGSQLERSERMLPHIPARGCCLSPALSFLSDLLSVRQGFM